MKNHSPPQGRQEQLRPDREGAPEDGGGHQGDVQRRAGPEGQPVQPGQRVAQEVWNAHDSIMLQHSYL